MKAVVLTSLAAILSVALAGCGTPTKVVNANSETVSVSFDGEQSTLASVNSKATEECQKVGRVAVLRDVMRVQDASVATYDCRRPQ